MACATGATPELVVISNRKPVDLNRARARYSPVSRAAPSIRIFVGAGEGTPGIVGGGQSVNRPVFVCNNCGSGMSAGGAAKTAPVTNNRMKTPKDFIPQNETGRSCLSFERTLT